jgi:hypothetical protein
VKPKNVDNSGFGWVFANYPQNKANFAYLGLTKPALIHMFRSVAKQ